MCPTFKLSSPSCLFSLPPTAPRLLLQQLHLCLFFIIELQERCCVRNCFPAANSGNKDWERVQESTPPCSCTACLQWLWSEITLLAHRYSPCCPRDSLGTAASWNLSRTPALRRGQISNSVGVVFLLCLICLVSVYFYGTFFLLHSSINCYWVVSSLPPSLSNVTTIKSFWIVYTNTEISLFSGKMGRSGNSPVCQ